MTLHRLTPTLLIAPAYAPFVSDFIARTKVLLGGNIHSLYMCGSIPRGTAIPGKSDADFTIVTNARVGIPVTNALEELKRNLVDEYPFVTKIDTPMCTVEQVLSEQYEWGFWVAIVSHCIFGPDLAEAIGPLISPLKLLVALCTDTETTVSQKLTRLASETNPESRRAEGKKLMRRLIRALVALTVVERDAWTDDLDESERILYEYFRKHGRLIETIFGMFSNPIDNVSDLTDVTNRAMKLYSDEYGRQAT